TARGEDEADVLLRPFLLSQINGYIGTETSQHGRIEKIDPVKAVQARTRRRGFGSIGQRHNECHLLNVLSHRKPGGAATLLEGLLIVCKTPRDESDRRAAHRNGTAFSAVAPSERPISPPINPNIREWYPPRPE